jgi:hypothetical protein
MSAGSASETPRPPAPTKVKRKVSMLRNVISSVLLVAFATVAIVEFRAYFSHKGAVSSLTARMPSDENANEDLLPLAEAEKIIGKAADGPGVRQEGQLKKTYTWQGFRKHQLIAYYTIGEPSALIKIETE